MAQSTQIGTPAPALHRLAPRRLEKPVSDGRCLFAILATDAEHGPWPSDGPPPATHLDEQSAAHHAPAKH